MSQAGGARCQWVGEDPLYVAYHDEEWGVPVHEDRVLFEMLTLEGAQAGLSWLTVLKKRAHYRRLFADFDAIKVARFSGKKMETLLRDPGIIRNRQKIEAAIRNAKATLAVREEFSSFDRYIWRFVDGEPIQNEYRVLGDLPAKTPESQAMSKDLLKRGFKFVGPTICHAFMQAVGMVNDHVVSCPRYDVVKKLSVR